MLPTSFQVALQFNYFKSVIVQKAKSSDNADVRTSLGSEAVGQRELLQEHRIGFKPKEFIGFKPLAFSRDHTGRLRLEAHLDGVLVAKKVIVLQSTEIDPETAKTRLKEAGTGTEGELAPKPPFCVPVLDTSLAGVSPSLVELPL